MLHLYGMSEGSAEIPHSPDMARSMPLETFVEGINRLRERNQRDFSNVNENLARLKKHSEETPLDDELRMADDLFMLTEGNTFSPIGISMTRRAKVALGTTNVRGEQVNATFYNFSPSLDDGDKFVSFLHAINPDEVKTDVFAGDSIAWLVDDLRDQAELDILQAEKDKPVTPKIVTHADQVVSELKRLGFPPDSYEKLNSLSEWAKKGVALEWILAKGTNLLEPVDTNNMIDFFVDEEGVPPENREAVQKNKLIRAKMRWKQLIETFNEVRSNPNAGELVALMRDGAQRLLDHIRETPLGREEAMRTELDEIQLTFMDDN